MELSSNCLNLDDKKLLYCLIEEEFKEEKQMEERNLMMKKQADLIKETRLLCFVSSILDQKAHSNTIVVLNGNDLVVE